MNESPTVRDVNGRLEIEWPNAPHLDATYPVSGELIQKFVDTENENRQLRDRLARPSSSLARTLAADPTKARSARSAVRQAQRLAAQFQARLKARS